MSLSSPSSPASRGSSPRLHEYYDHYLGKYSCFLSHQRVVFSMKELLNPCELVYSAVCMRALAQRARGPLHRSLCFTQLEFRPLQLQRYLRGFVIFTAYGLVALPASWRVEEERWVDLIFMRVMRGFAGRAEVRLQAAHRVCACCAALRRVLCSRFKVWRLLY